MVQRKVPGTAARPSRAFSSSPSRLQTCAGRALRPRLSCGAPAPHGVAEPSAPENRCATELAFRQQRGHVLAFPPQLHGTLAQNLASRHERLCPAAARPGEGGGRGRLRPPAPPTAAAAPQDRGSGGGTATVNLERAARGRGVDLCLRRTERQEAGDVKRCKDNVSFADDVSIRFCTVLPASSTALRSRFMRTLCGLSPSAGTPRRLPKVAPPPWRGPKRSP